MKHQLVRRIGLRGAFVKFDRVSLHLLAVDFDRDCNSIQNQLLKFYYLAIGVREVADSNPVVPFSFCGSRTLPDGQVSATISGSFVRLTRRLVLVRFRRATSRWAAFRTVIRFVVVGRRLGQREIGEASRQRQDTHRSIFRM